MSNVIQLFEPDDEVFVVDAEIIVSAKTEEEAVEKLRELFGYSSAFDVQLSDFNIETMDKKEARLEEIKEALQ